MKATIADIADPSWQRLIGVGDNHNPEVLVTEENVEQVMLNFFIRGQEVIVRDGQSADGPQRALGWIEELERRGHEAYAFVRWCVPQSEVDLFANGLGAMVMLGSRSAETGEPLGWVLVEAFPREADMGDHLDAAAPATTCTCPPAPVSPVGAP